MNWSTLSYLVPEDFSYPDKISGDILYALDDLIGRLGRKPIILSDYRSGDSGQHGQGRAVDFWCPGLDSITVINQIKNSKLFSGYGMYINENKIVSFHVDTRIDRTPENPATWGAYISPDESGNRAYKYVALKEIYEIVKKYAFPAGIILTAVIILLVLMRSK